MSGSTGLLIPGQPLPSAFNDAKFVIGSGCYRREGRILASVVGRAVRVGDVVSVKGKEEGSVVPYIGAEVIGTITRLTPLSAHLTLSSLPPFPLPTSDPFLGQIRLPDIRLVDKDRVKIAECFRSGDVVRARVLGMGDGRSYWLGTGENRLGVLEAVSEGGNPLVPVNWEEMQDSITGAREKRKVADPNAAV